MTENSELMTQGVAAEKGKLHKPLAMAWFLGPDTKRIVNGGKPGTGLAIGQLIGRINAVETVHGVYKGTPTTSPLAIGTFEAVKYIDGTVSEPLGWYGPGYFLKTVREILATGAFQNGISVALECWIIASGKDIPYSYEVKDLGTRAANDPLEDIKRRLQSSGRLRLPPPVAVSDEMITLPGVERLAPLPADDGIDRTPPVPEDGEEAETAGKKGRRAA